MFRAKKDLATFKINRVLAYFNEPAKHRNTIESPVAGRATFTRMSLPPGFNNFFMFVNVLSSSCALRGFDATMMSKAPSSNPWLVISSSIDRVLKVMLVFVTPKCSFASFTSRSVADEKTYLGRVGTASDSSGVAEKSDEASPPLAVPNSRRERFGSLCASTLTNYISSAELVVPRLSDFQAYRFDLSNAFV